jgi:glycerol uptake facilitator-like aquaporin
MSDSKVSNKSLMQESIADMVGTAIFTLVVLSATNSWMVGVGLVAVLICVGNFAGTTINPAISTALLINGQITRKQWVHHVFFQILGAVAGVLIYCWINGKRVNWFGADCKPAAPATTSS